MCAQILQTRLGKDLMMPSRLHLTVLFTESKCSGEEYECTQVSGGTWKAGGSIKPLRSLSMAQSHSFYQIFLWRICLWHSWWTQMRDVFLSFELGLWDYVCQWGGKGQMSQGAKFLSLELIITHKKPCCSISSVCWLGTWLWYSCRGFGPMVCKVPKSCSWIKGGHVSALSFNWNSVKCQGNLNGFWSQTVLSLNLHCGIFNLPDLMLVNLFLVQLLKPSRVLGQ